jgi:hypothetical protein
MNLEYELVEDSFDDTTHIRTMTEQATVAGKGWLLRTTLYTPHHITANIVFIPATGGASEKLFDAIP